MSHNKKVIRYYDKIADLERPNNFDSNICQVGGYASINDGGGGTFIWDKDALLAEDDGGTIISPDSGATGLWKRVYSGHMNVKWFGAKGDDLNDDTTAIQAALNGDARSVFFPQGTYRISTDITLGSYIDIIADKDAKIYRNVDGSGDIFSADNENDIRINGLIIEGSVSIVTDTDTVKGIDFDNCSNIWIEDCKILHCSECIEINFSDKIWIKNCDIYEFSNIGITCSRSASWHILGNVVRDCFGQSQNYCITCTGQSGDQKECVISNNTLLDNPSWSAIMIHDTYDVRVIGNIMKNVRNGIDFGHLTSGNDVECIIIANNYIEGATVDFSTGKNCGIYVYGVPGKNCKNVTITGNVVRAFNKFGGPSTPAGGIGLGFIDRLTVVGNSIYDVDSAGNSRAAGICIFFDLNSATISNNAMEDCVNGVHCFNSQLNDVVFSGNTIRNSTRGFWLDGVISSRSKIFGNEINATNKIIHAAVGGLQPIHDIRYQSGTITTAIAPGTTYSNNAPMFGVRAGDPIGVTINTSIVGLIITAHVNANDSIVYQAYNSTGGTINLTNEVFSVVPIIRST